MVRQSIVDGSSLFACRNQMEIGKLALRLFELAASLHERDFRSVHFTPGNGALLQQFFTAVVDFLLGFKGGLCCCGVELRFRAPRGRAFF